MSKLDQIKYIAKLDRSKMRDSLERLPDQFLQAWREMKHIALPAHYRRASNIVVSGMGGSGLAGRLATSLFSDQLSIPLQHVHDYQLPRAVTNNTLCFLSSYSGGTEEIISTFQIARQRKAKMFVFAKGGKLAQLAKKHALPCYTFEEFHNPCGQPRMGLGYSLTPILSVLSRLRYIKFSERDFLDGVKILQNRSQRLNPVVPARNNPAKKIATELHGHLIGVVASEFLSGNAHIFSNQINENGKNYATDFLIPELNHHLLEGLVNPRLKRRDLAFVFIESALYQIKNQYRHAVTQQVVRRLGIKEVRHRLSAKTESSQSFEMLILGSYVSFYLAMLNKIDPSPIPWVDYFKDKLAQR